jgi:transposase
VVIYRPIRECGDAPGLWLSDAQWERLAPLLPNEPRGVALVDDRLVISGIVVALQSGGRWIDVPAEYELRRTLYNRLVRWLAKGVWQQVFADQEHPKHLHQRGRCKRAQQQSYRQRWPAVDKPDKRTEAY